MHTGPLAAPPALQMQAALAEAWHVDGRFAQALAGWEALTLAGVDRAEAALKAAISCFSARRQTQGFAWLDRAREAGAATEETLYVRAQACWQQGRVQEAIDLFQQAEQAAPQLGKASNALGVLYWQLARVERAARQFALALQRDPCDAEALVNAASLSLRQGHAPEKVQEHLARAAALQPQRAEAFVWYARLRRQQHAEDEAREALARARLRGLFRGPISQELPPVSPAESGCVQVSGTCSAERTRLTLRYTCPPGADPPGYLAVNRGYDQVTAGGCALAPVSAEEVGRHFGLPLAAMLVYYAVPADAWQGEAPVLEVVVVGRPLPPCVTLGAAEIELDGCSGWLPLPLPPLLLRWQLAVQFPPGLRLFPSTHQADLEAPGLIALCQPVVHAPEDPGVPAVIARQDSPLVRLAPLLVQRTRALWEARVGELRCACPAVIIVDQPTSLFCYTRSAYLRLPAGLARRLELAAQLCHEVGHLWWGLQVRFVPADAWLGEALAEYSLHLAEEAGWLTGYRKNALALLCTLQQGTLPADGLADLHRRAGKSAAYALRVKGGYLIAMLRTLMGESAFWGFLRCVYDQGCRQRFDAYHFFALASRWHGASLNWFVNQWVYTATQMAFAVEDCRLSRAGQLFALACTARCRGVATPAGPVTVAIRCEGGEERRSSVHLELGRAPIHVVVPTRPQRVILDPDLCWYAQQGEQTIAGGDVYL